MIYYKECHKLSFLTKWGCRQFFLKTRWKTQICCVISSHQLFGGKNTELKQELSFNFAKRPVKSARTPNFYALYQRCPKVFFHSPHSYDRNLKNFFYIFELMKISKHLGPPYITILYFLTERCELKLDNIVILFKTSQFSNIRRQIHSPHSKEHSPHVANGEWVGQRCSIS